MWTNKEVKCLDKEECVACKRADGKSKPLLRRTSGSISVEINDEPKFISPFLDLKPVLRVFQVLGVFNFSISSDFSEFACRPLRLLYSLLLNLFLLLLLFLTASMTASDASLEWTGFKRLMLSTLGPTDLVVALVFFVLLEKANWGLHLYNANLCGFLNDLVKHVEMLGVIDAYEKQNPDCRVATTFIIAITSLTFFPFFAVGITAYEIVGMSTDLDLRLCSGLVGAMLITYLHLPQFVSELLFMRMVNVVDLHCSHLLRHMNNCGEQQVNKSGPEAMCCCLERCRRLLQLVSTVNLTFSKQLVIQFTVITGTLIFAVYFSIAFLLGMTSRDNYYMHSLVFCLYALTPLLRLVLITHFVNCVLVKMECTRHKLYEMETRVHDNHVVKAHVGCLVQQCKELKGFSAENFFVVNNKLVTAILGYLATYIIVLVQFKINDMAKYKSFKGQNIS